MAIEPYTTEDFTLPVGLKKNGTVYTRGTMRSMTAGDSLFVFKDANYQRILKNVTGTTVKMKFRNTGGQMMAGIQEAIEDGEMDMDPVMIEHLKILTFARAMVILPRVIIAMEGLERKAIDMGVINRNDIELMHEADIVFLMNKVQELTNSVAPKPEGSSPNPLA